jgi:hypothetical protein
MFTNLHHYVRFINSAFKRFPSTWTCWNLWKIWNKFLRFCTFWLLILW